MIPIFCEDPKPAAVIEHSMDMTWEAVNYVNKGQPIVAALHQPMYVIAKRIQWQ